MRPIRIGLLVPHTDTTLEWDLQRRFGGRCSLHTERMFLADVTVDAEIKMMEDEAPRAVGYLKAIKPDILVFGCTSAGALYGVDGERAFTAGLGQTLGCPAISAFGSVMRHLSAIRAERIALFTPYTAEVHEEVVSSVRESGVEVIWDDHLGLIEDSDIGNLDPSALHARLAGAPIDPTSCDTLFMSCTNLRADEIAGDLSVDLGVHVFGSNSAIIGSLNALLRT